VWNLCNSNCIMCTNPKDFRNLEDAKEYTDQKILERMESDRESIERSNSDIGLTGGEPTIRPGFTSFLKEIRRRFPSNTIAFATNGRMLAYENFTKEFLKVGNLRLQSVVHSADSKVHDEITRSPGSFEQTKKGLKNFFKYRSGTQTMELRIILLKQNYRELEPLVKMIYEEFPSVDRLVIIFPEYEGHAGKNLEHIKVTFEDVRPYVEDIVARWSKSFKYLYLYHFPLCAISYRYWEHLVRSLPPGYHELFFMEKCNNCFYKDCCLGVYKDYVHFFGEEYFSPLKERKEVEKNHDNYQHPIKLKKRI